GDADWQQKEARRQDGAYRAAFTEYLGRPPAWTEEDVAALQRSELAPELATALAHWATIRRHAGTDAAETARLLEVAGRLDPNDPWRAELHAVLAAPALDRRRLEQLAAGADVAPR